MKSLSGLLEKAEEFFRSGDLLRAYSTYREAVNVARRMKKVTEEVLMAYNNFVILRLKLASSKNELLNVKNNALEFLRVAKKAKNRSDFYAVACFHVGNVMLALKEYEEAVKYLEEAMVVFEILDNKEGVMLSCKALAEAYDALGYKTQSSVYSMRAKAIAKELGDEKSLRDIEETFKVWKVIPWNFSK